MTPPLTDAELAALAEYLGHVPVNTPERAELYGKIPRLFAEVKSFREKAWRGRPVLTVEEVKAMPCVLPPDVQALHDWIKDVESERDKLKARLEFIEREDAKKPPFGYVVAWTDARRKPSFHYDQIAASIALVSALGFGSSGKVVDVYEKGEKQP